MSKKSLLLLFILFFNFNAFSNDASQPLSIFNISETAITIANQYPDYVATPGDVYKINFIVANSEKQEISAFVDSNYNIDLSFIGKVNVKGLKYTEVQEKLKSVISSSYPGSIINVLIVAPGQFKVVLLGEVLEASLIEALSLNTLSEILHGRLTPYASIRDIEIRSEDGTLKVYDLFQFTRFADLKNNPFLQPNDVITIRPFKKSVKIAGEIKRPGAYQLLESDKLSDLINLYGDGLTKKAQLGKVVIESPLRENTLYLDATEDDLSVIELQDYDIVTVASKVSYYPTVSLQGAVSSQTGSGSNVSNKIVVPITANSKVSTLIKNMEGSFNLSSDLEKAFILRDGKKIDVNLNDVIYNPESKHDIEIQDKDTIVVPFRQLVVHIAGSVNSPTSVPFIENRTAEYYIGQAGGFNLSENYFRTFKITNVYGERVKKDSIISPEDMIWVNKDHPIAYINEYAGYITTIASAIVLGYSLYSFTDLIRNGGVPTEAPTF